MGTANRDYDIVILGGGSSGIVSGVMAGGLGLRVLLIEKEKMGGECLNTGCVPSKALLHAAGVAHTIRTASEIGLTPLSLSRADAAGVLAHVRDTIAVVRDADATEQMLRDYGVEIRIGDARFTDAHTLLLQDQRITADSFILATGSSPAIIDIPGLEATGYRTNKTIFDLEEIPERMLVVGGGPIGVEMAQAFQRLGSQVTLIEKGERLLPRDDAELTGILTDHLRAEGMDIRLNASVASVRQEGERRLAAIQGSADEVVFDELLLAVGRTANVQGLDLDAAGVRHNSECVPTNERLQTSTPHIYACGDLLGGYQFSHMAEHEAKIIVRNIAFPGASRETFGIAPWATFTDPELAHVGLTEAEAAARGLDFEVYRQPFAQNDRAITDNAAHGLIKVLTQGVAGKILGVQILGPRAGELLQEWILAMEQGHSIRAIADMIHVYPTLSLASQHVAQRWYERKAKEPLAREALRAYIDVIRPREKTIGLGALALGLAGVGASLLRKRRNG